VLKQSGKGLVHTSNITATAGFARFEQQKEASVQGFCFTSPDAVRVMVKRAGLEIVQESQIDQSNVYYYRDYLCVVKPSTGER